MTGKFALPATEPSEVGSGGSVPAGKRRRRLDVELKVASFPRTGLSVAFSVSLSAVLVVRITKNHPLPEGNKRLLRTGVPGRMFLDTGVLPARHETGRGSDTRSIS